MSQVTYSSPVWNLGGRFPRSFLGYDKLVDGCSMETNTDPDGSEQSFLIPGMLLAASLYLDLSDPYGNRQEFKTAVGFKDRKTFAEIQYEKFIYALIYNQETGTCKAAKVEGGRYSRLSFKAGGAADDEAWCFGEPLFLAMMKDIENNTEAKDLLESIRCHSIDEQSDDGCFVLNKDFGILSDNVYRRVLEGSLKLDLDDEGVFEPLTVLDVKANIPEIVERGKFKVFTSESISIVDGEFTLYPQRAYSKEEKERIPHIENHVVSATEYQIAELAKKIVVRGGKRPLNFILEGGVGSGKSQMAKHLAQLWNMPYATIVLSENTMEEHVTEHIAPEIGKDADDMPFLKGIEEIVEKGELFVDMNPDIAFKMLTGKDNPDAEASDVAVEALRKVLNAGKSRGDISYRLVQSEVIKALTRGWVLEIQEPTLMANPSVLGILNDAMNSSEGLIVTEHGIYQRHPDAVVIYTTNRYASNVPFNPSVRDRCRVFKIETPKAEDLVSRLERKSFLKDRATIRRMVDIVNSLAETVRECELDGQIGTRGLIDWCDDVALGIPFEEAMLNDIIYRITTDEDELMLLNTTLIPYGIDLTEGCI